MQAVTPTATWHQTPRELVHDHDATVFDHVVHVEMEQRVRPEPLMNMVEQGHVDRVVQTAGVRRETMAEHLLRLGHAALGKRDGLVFLVDDVVAGRFELLAVLRFDIALSDRALLQPRDDAIDFVIQIGGFLGRAGDDERGARFVDQDAVDFVDDGEVMTSLDHRPRSNFMLSRR